MKTASETNLRERAAEFLSRASSNANEEMLVECGTGSLTEVMRVSVEFGFGKVAKNAAFRITEHWNRFVIKQDLNFPTVALRHATISFALLGQTNEAVSLINKLTSHQECASVIVECSAFAAAGTEESSIDTFIKMSPDSQTRWQSAEEAAKNLVRHRGRRFALHWARNRIDQTEYVHAIFGIARSEHDLRRSI